MDPTRLVALTMAEIERITLRYADDPRAWLDAMRSAVGTGHTAGVWAGVAERGFGGRVRQWLSGVLGERALPRADRERLRARLRQELGYLERFAAEWDQLSPAQRRARAAMYAGAVRATYYEARYGDWDIPARLMPGNQRCLSNCRCTISIRDNDDGTGTLTRSLNGEQHCTECPGLAGDHEIRRRR